MEKKQKIFISVIFVGIILAFEIVPDKFSIWYFGMRYNEVREMKEIPIIPQNWKCKKTSPNYLFCHPIKEDVSSSYKGKEIEIKYFSIISERDTYMYEDAEKGKQKLSIARIIVSSN
ncbi:MAG: hypothetical protein AAFV95_28740 [Bacteroidota bacterium]